MYRLMGRLWSDDVLVSDVAIYNFHERSSQFVGSFNTLQQVHLQTGVYVIELDDGRRFPVQITGLGEGPLAGAS